MVANTSKETEKRYVAVDPVDLERGDRVIVQDVASDLEVEGEVTGTTNEAGRVAVIIKEDDGTESVAWENTGRTYTRIEEAATDGGGVEYTELEIFAARLSGKLSLDASAVEGQGVAKITATEATLEDNRDRLDAEGFNTELYVDGEIYEPPTLLVYPRPGDLETVEIPVRHAKILKDAAATLTEDIGNGREWGRDEEASRENGRDLNAAGNHLRGLLATK